MPSELRQSDLSLREKLADVLQGDAKPGSIRERLVHGMVGGTGRQDGMPLADFSPLGIVFAGDEGSRALNAGRYGDAAGAMAGLIPGAGALEKMGANEIRNLASKLREKGVANADIRRLQQIAAQKEAYDQSRLPKLDRANPAAHLGRTDPRSAVRDSIDDEISARNAAQRNTVAPSMRQSLDKAAKDVGTEKPATLHPSNEGAFSRKGPEELDSSRKNAILKNFNDNFEVGMEAGRQDNHINELAGGDPDKAHFIKNAMQDEGGNVPEDVAMTLIDHLHQKNEAENLGGATEQLLQDLMRQHDTTNPEELASKMVETHSIPEMLAMHYDLDPAKFKGVYSPAGMSRPKGKSTQ